MLLLSSADIFQNLLFQKNTFRTTIRVKWFGSRSGQTVCKRYQQMAKADTGMRRIISNLGILRIFKLHI